MRSNKLILKQIALIMILSMIISTVAYIFSPNLSYATESVFTRDTGNVGLITWQSGLDEEKKQIATHDGYGGIGRDGIGYGITDIDTFLSTYTNNHDGGGTYAWLSSLINNDSIFCSHRGLAFPSVKDSLIDTFHSGAIETHVEANKSNMKAYVGTEKVDFVEHLVNKDKYVCDATIEVIPVNWKTETGDTERLQKEYVVEKDFKYPSEKGSENNHDANPSEGSGAGEPDDYTQVSMVNLQYTASPRNLTTREAYYYSYSDPNKYYNANPAQNANWLDKEGWANDEGGKLYAASLTVEKFEDPKKPEISKTTITDSVIGEYGTGTVLDETGNYFIIGPIYMNDYDYAWCAGAKDYSGELICGIIESKLILDNNTEIVLTGENFGYYEQNEARRDYVKGNWPETNYNYESPALHGYAYPTPDSKFYVKVPVSSCVGATSVKEINMKYKWLTAKGYGGDLNGFYYQLTWTGQKQYADGCNSSTEYSCPNTDAHGHSCNATKRTAAQYIDDLTYYSHKFVCSTEVVVCQYGSECDTTSYNDVTSGSTLWTSFITKDCKSTWACGEYAHKHGDHTLNDYQKEDGNEYLSDLCGHTHKYGCYVKNCSYADKEDHYLTCKKTVHTHKSGCSYSKNLCDHLYEGCTSSYCKVDTTNPNNPKKCDHKHDGDCCIYAYHTHDYNDCYHNHTGESKSYGGCYKKKVCGHTPNSTSCEQFALGNYACCVHEEHTHVIGTCKKTHDCVTDYCRHGFNTRKNGGTEHNCNQNYSTGKDHAASTCNAKPWGQNHIGYCKGDTTSDTPATCKHGHANCKKLIWKVREDKDVIKRTSQELMYVHHSLVEEHTISCKIENIPLVTKVEINKYIYDVEHTVVLGNNNTMAASDARGELEEQTKADYPVYVEYGDLVTYKIVLTNESAFGIETRIEDVLPDCDYDFISAHLGSRDVGTVEDLRNTPIQISGGGEASLTVTIRVKEFDGLYENLAKIITRNGTNKNPNSDDVDYIRTTDDDGPVINNIETTVTYPIQLPKIEAKDYFTLNNYNAFVDKYVFKYDQLMQEENNSNGYTNEASIVNNKDELLISRENTTQSMADYVDPKDAFGLTDRRRTDNGAKEEYKKNHPVNVEKYETITYAIKVSNDATVVNREEPTGVKYATQVRPSQVTDLMHKGLKVTGVDGKIYQGTTVVKDALGVSWSGPVSDGEFNKYTITLDNNTILEPGQHMLFLVEAEVIQSNMYLPSMENKAELTKVTNVNSTDTEEIEVTERNIAEHKETSEFVRMKDLIISGKVWVDFNRDGLMNDTSSKDRNEQYGLVGVNKKAMKEDILVSLYKKDGTTPVRTTRTDSNGFFTFGRGEGLGYHATFNYNNQYSSSTTYQRVDKATGKDANGNYGSGSQYIEYYIEYEYDGVIYKSTEVYAGMSNLKQNDGRYDPKYLIDSNATELDEDREEFNNLYEYISYNIAYDTNKNAQTGSSLSFDKDGHISTLIESDDRKMTAKSFVTSYDKAAVLKACKTAMNSCGSAKWKQCSNHWDDWQVAISMGIIDESAYANTTAGRKAAQKYLQDIYNSLSNSSVTDVQQIKYLWLYGYNEAVDNTVPETEYLKYINLGLEVREDVDIALFKDVYSVTTLIDGEEIEYAFNQKNDINGDGKGEDYIITNPYGLELYEADYKKRVDQYISEAVRDYKGIGSELNVNVTYRIRLNNIPTVDDKYLPSATDEKLDVRVHEILDLYDQNFKTYSDTETVEVKVTDANGFLKSENRKISEAWFFKEGASGTKYKKVNTITGEPIYVEDPAGTYGKVSLTVSNSSLYSRKANNFIDEGYKTMYIRTNNETDIVVGEGEHFDIYVKYTLDKDKAEVTVDTETFEDTKTSETEVTIGGKTYPMSVSTTTTKTTLERSLKIAEDVASKVNPRGIENIAQVNAYSVYNEDGSPAALVDVDSNAGNVGVGEGKNNTSEVNCDDVSLYEDMTYKTGIQIIANNTENDISKIPSGNGSVIEFSQRDLKRDIKGKVWDDSKTETKAVEGEPGAKIFYADGRSDTSSEKLKAAESFEVKTNENVKLNYDLAKTTAEKEEKADLPIRNVKVEFIEIVKLPNGRYYEQLLRNVTWEQEQQVRSDKNGEYILRGLTPGDYVVRFTYGDSISDDEPHVTNVAEAREDMRIFNGQDYKSTKYTLALADDETDVDTIIQSFNAPGTSDARDDEMRRLTVNKYSEVMTNQKAEILKGLINDENASIKNRYNPLNKNSEEDLTELTDKTHMYAETIEFTLKPEKFKGEQITKYIKYGLEKDGGIYYDVQTIVANEDIDDRDYIIENLDFGIEYRPESQISLTKEINQMKLTAEDGTVLVDLYFYTEGEGKQTVHKIDKDKSKGLDVVQFVTNQYTDKATKVQALVNKIVEEQVQGFVYVQVDDEILQGATVEITYKFFAQNNSELDMIRDVLDEIRYKENKQTVALIDKYREKGHNILDEDYTASGTAENALLTELYGLDENAVKTLGANYTINDYIDLVDRLESTQNPLDKANLEEQKANIIANYLYRKGPKTITKSGDDGYYGRYVGYGYYTGYTYPAGSGLDKKDVVACLKFDKILDYVDTNLEYTQETNNEKLENRFWVVTDAEDLNDHVYALRNKQLELVNVGGTEEDEVKKITNVKGQVYNSLVVSVDDSLFDDTAERRPANADPNRVVLNKNLSRFLLPYLADKTADKTQSKGYIFLPTSKVIAAETDTDDLQYENIAEIIQFTTVTGRRTNFETTIGNANVHSIDKTPGGPNIGSEEFETASFEPDTAATETITLTPPTGLMLSRRAIVNVVETTTKGLGITAIAAAVVGIVFAVTTVTRLIIKKRRIK